MILWWVMRHHQYAKNICLKARRFCSSPIFSRKQDTCRHRRTQGWGTVPSFFFCSSPIFSTYRPFFLHTPGCAPPLCPILGAPLPANVIFFFFALHRYFQRIDLSFCTSPIDMTEVNFCNTVIEDQSHQKWVTKKKGWEPLR